MLCLFFLSCLFSFKNQFTEASSFIRVINPLHWSGLSFDKEGNMSLWKHIEQLIESVEGFEKQACSQVSRNTQKSTAELVWREGSLRPLWPPWPPSPAKSINPAESVAPSGWVLDLKIPAAACNWLNTVDTAAACLQAGWESGFSDFWCVKVGSECGKLLKCRQIFQRIKPSQTTDVHCTFLTCLMNCKYFSLVYILALFVISPVI